MRLKKKGSPSCQYLPHRDSLFQQTSMQLSTYQISQRNLCPHYLRFLKRNPSASGVLHRKQWNALCSIAESLINIGPFLGSTVTKGLLSRRPVLNLPCSWNSTATIPPGMKRKEFPLQCAVTRG